MLSWFKNLFQKSDSRLIVEYLKAGRVFGEAVSYIYFGETVGFGKMLDKLIKLEEQVVERGYRPESIDTFVEYGGYGKEVSKLQKLDNDDPIFHAKMYQTDRLCDNLGCVPGDSGIWCGYCGRAIRSPSSS